MRSHPSIPMSKYLLIKIVSGENNEGFTHQENLDRLKKILSFLDANNININYLKAENEPSRGNTVLHLAVINNELDYALLLIQHGADFWQQNFLGQYPYELTNPTFGMRMLTEFDSYQNKKKTQAAVNDLKNQTTIREKNLLSNAHTLCEKIKGINEKIHQLKEEKYISAEKNIDPLKIKIQSLVKNEFTLWHNEFIELKKELIEKKLPTYLVDNASKELSVGILLVENDLLSMKLQTVHQLLLSIREIDLQKNLKTLDKVVSIFRYSVDLKRDSNAKILADLETLIQTYRRDTKEIDTVKTDAKTGFCTHSAGMFKSLQTTSYQLSGGDVMTVTKSVNVSNNVLK